MSNGLSEWPKSRTQHSIAEKSIAADRDSAMLLERQASRYQEVESLRLSPSNMKEKEDVRSHTGNSPARRKKMVKKKKKKSKLQKLQSSPSIKLRKSNLVPNDDIEGFLASKPDEEDEQADET